MTCSSFKSLVVLFFIANYAQCYPYGAPSKVCKTLEPQHSYARAQTSKSPYTITPNKTRIPIGGYVNVTISADSRTFYRGFVLQARYGIVNPAGNFKILDASLSQILDCLSTLKHTVTHTSAVKKTSTTFVYTPAPVFVGTVYFIASFVQDFRTFWVNVSSKVVVGESDTMEPEWYELDPAEADTSYESGSSGRSSVDFSSQMYEECGSTKACFGLPENCVSTSSCDVIASVAAKDSKFEFELMGINVEYVSILLSENRQVNADSMTTCALVNDQVKLLNPGSYNKYMGAGSQYNNRDETLINSTYVDGVLYCKFLRDEIIELNDVYFDLKNKQYFLILAAGNMQDVKEIMKVKKMQFHVSARKNYLSDVSGFTEPTISNEIPSRNYLFYVMLKDWFFGVFQYFMIL